MAFKIEFTKPDKVNGIGYKKGDTLSVSDSIYKTLKEAGTVKDFKEKKSQQSEKEE